nr:MAG TPA: hypothetical protein [Caudoviricetes sp.]
MIYCPQFSRMITCAGSSRPISHLKGTMWEPL